MLSSLLAVAATAKPAGGAATNEVIGVSAAAMVFTIALFVLGMGHRNGRVKLLGWGADLSERVSGLPGWVALPSALASVSLITAVFGMYWDISLHIDVGRDPGPLANPAHYFILAGLFGIFASGFFAMVIPTGTEAVSSSSIRIARDWHAPLGGVLICSCGIFSLIGFPLDDLWHRLFGQDVTLWGPTHLMLIGGAAMTLIGIAVLHTEGKRALDAAGKQSREQPWVATVRAVGLSGGLLIGMSTFQGEFDFGVPQFRMVFGPMLVMLAAGLALTLARLWIGRGAAIGAALFFLVIRGGLALMVGPILGQTTPKFPLYLGCAIVVEVVALLVPRERVLSYALWSGIGIGTIGLASEWLWTQVWMPIPWPTNLLPEGALLGFGMAVFAALVGTWVATRLSDTAFPRPPALRIGAVVAAIGITALTAYSLYRPAVEPGTSATVRLTDVNPGPNRTVQATVRLHPANAADDAEWFTGTSWQGGGFVVERMKKIGTGLYRTTKPLPVHGDWKSMIRLHRGAELAAVPIYLPEDKAIPAKGVPAPRTFTREFASDKRLLQREQKTGVAGWLTAVAYLTVAAIGYFLLGLLAWGLHRLARVAPGATPSSPGARRSDRAPATRTIIPAGQSG